MNNEEQEKLVKSILAKAPETDYSEISINKFLKKILELIDPVISDQRLWRILSEFGKPIKSELPDLSKFVSTDMIGRAEALNIRNTRKLSSMEKRIQLKMANNLESSGSSERLTKLRREQPLYPSQVLGNSFKYGGKQLERKAFKSKENYYEIMIKLNMMN